MSRNWEALHIKLLNKLKYRAKSDKWESVFGRFLINHALHYDGIEAEAVKLINLDESHVRPSNNQKTAQLGYSKLSFDIRAKAFLTLLEMQFDRNQQFKDKVNLRLHVDLRSRPIGVDIWGRNYWLLKDLETNVYLYRDDPCSASLEVCFF